VNIRGSLKKRETESAVGTGQCTPPVGKRGGVNKKTSENVCRTDKGELLSAAREENLGKKEKKMVRIHRNLGLCWLKVFVKLKPDVWKSLHGFNREKTLGSCRRCGIKEKTADGEKKTILLKRRKMVRSTTRTGHVQKKPGGLGEQSREKYLRRSKGIGR